MPVPISLANITIKKNKIKLFYQNWIDLVELYVITG